MEPFKRRIARASTGFFAVVLASLPVRTAHADPLTDFGDDLGRSIGRTLETFLTVTGTALIADITFTIHDVWLLNNGQRQGIGWSIAESVLTVPQALFLDGALVWAHSRGDDDDRFAMDALAVVPAVWSSQLATHGIWSLASDRVRPGDLYGVSWAIGANLTFTAGAVGGLFGKRLGGSLFGIMEMVGTTPSIAVGLYRSFAQTEPDRGAWIALSAWSGALFLHGLAAAVVPGPNKEEDQGKATGRRAPFFFSPTVVSDGIRQAPGLAMRGRF